MCSLYCPCSPVTTFLLSMPSPPIFALEMILNFHRDVRVKCHPLSWARDTRPSRRSDLALFEDGLFVSAGARRKAGFLSVLN